MAAPQGSITQGQDSLRPLDSIYEVLKAVDQAWLESTLRAKWQEHNNACTANTSLATEESSLSSNEPVHHASAAISLGFHDVTAPQDAVAGSISHANFSTHISRFRQHDWSSTELGPMSSWSIELRQMVNICMYMPTAAALWWGLKRVCIFNEAYAVVLVDRAEWAFGKTMDEVWHDIPGDNDYRQAMLHADRTGLSTISNTTCYFVERDGFMTEVWASFSIQPLVDNRGTLGFLNTVVDHTADVVRNRRAAVLLALRQKLATLTELADFSDAVIDCLSLHLEDVPFAAMYQACDLASSAHGGSPGQDGLTAVGRWALARLVAADSTKTDLPNMVDVDSAASLLGVDLPKVAKTGDIQVLQTHAGSESRPFWDQITSRAWGDRCRKILVIPCRQEQMGTLTHFLLLGVNPRAADDDDYASFATLLGTHLQVALTAVMIYADRKGELAYGMKLTAKEHRLAGKLDAAELDNKHMEARFHKMADKSPVPMFEVGADGELKYANDSWFELSGHPRDQLAPFQWVNTIHENDRGWFADTWSRLAAGETLAFEIRFVKPYITDDFVDGKRLEGTTWVSASAYAERDSEGNVQNVLGTTADISRHKWLESFQSRRATEALELKTQQEAFMDMISHEARNPLGAITLCAENVINLLQGKNHQWSADQTTTIEAASDDARTILACATHQKSIIDDVLTLSKLNTGMLAVCPVPVQPTQIVLETLATFANSALQAELDLRFNEHPSVKELGIDWVMVDPVRLQQILINLVSNAIKFTKDVPSDKRVVVTLSAQNDPPVVMEAGEIMPEATVEHPVRVGDDGSHDLYLLISVEDNGCGIRPGALKSLFKRFEQGSLKTHVKYGGSGLGLHICRTLASLQGGRIGVTSVHGKGSTFEFFVATRACDGPPVKPRPSIVDESATSSVDITANVPASKPLAQAAHDAHILLVEDNLVNQRVMAKLLRRLSYTVTVANHGQEALDFMYDTTSLDSPIQGLDLILMDIEMPVMNGLQCIQHIREREKNVGAAQKIPVAAVTAYARAEQQTKALEAGFDAVITKPFRLDDLQQLLEQYGLHDSG